MRLAGRKIDVFTVSWHLPSPTFRISSGFPDVYVHLREDVMSLRELSKGRCRARSRCEPIRRTNAFFVRNVLQSGRSCANMKR